MPPSVPQVRYDCARFVAPTSRVPFLTLPQDRYVDLYRDIPGVDPFVSAEHGYSRTCLILVPFLSHFASSTSSGFCTNSVGSPLVRRRTTPDLGAREHRCQRPSVLHRCRRCRRQVICELKDLQEACRSDRRRKETTAGSDRRVWQIRWFCFKELI